MQTSLAEEALFTLSASNDDDISQALEMLLSRPHDEQVMDAAKASGKMLFADFPPDARKRKIDAMVRRFDNYSVLIMLPTGYGYDIM